MMALCEKPFIVDGMPCPCGSCDVCRIRRKRLWANRIMLESYCHGDSTFITLTYDDEHLPDSCGDDCQCSGDTLRPKDAQDWLKRLRLAIAPRKIRYFLAGEYGDETWRPHYHVAVFGLSQAEESVVRDTWNMGHVVCGSLTPASASYIAGYVTKKMTKKGDARLVGRHREFTRMSLKPGIGATAIRDMSLTLQNEHGLDWVLRNGDVPVTFREGRTDRSLGRYLRRKLREDMGFAEKDCPPEKLEEYKKQMRELFASNVKVASFEKPLYKSLMSDWFVSQNLGKIRNMKSRANIFAARKVL